MLETWAFIGLILSAYMVVRILYKIFRYFDDRRIDRIYHYDKTNRLMEYLEALSKGKGKM